MPCIAQRLPRPLAPAASAWAAHLLTTGVAAALLALLTALCYGLANYLGPVLTRRTPLAGVLLTSQVVGFVGGGLLLLVRGGNVPTGQHLAEGLGAGVCNSAALALAYTASAVGPMSIVAPIGATGAIVPVAVALATGEQPTALELAGIPLAVLGVVLAASRRQNATTQHAAPRTVVLAVLSAVCFGGFLTLFGAASADHSPWAVFSSRISLLAMTTAFVLLRRPAVRFPLTDLPIMTVPGVLLLAGTISYGVATTQGLVSVVAVLATLSPVVTVGLAVTMLHERLSGRQRSGVALALVGVVLLAAG